MLFILYPSINLFTGFKFKLSFNYIKKYNFIYLFGGGEGVEEKQEIREFIHFYKIRYRNA